MNPTPEEITQIRGQLTDWTPDNATLVVELNAATIPNPTPARTVPRPVGSMEFLGSLSQASMVKVIAFQHLIAVKASIAEQNRPAMLEWVQVLTIAQCITPAEAQACSALINADIPDPAHRALLSWSEINLGREVDEADVQAARVYPKLLQAEAILTMVRGLVSDLRSGLDRELPAWEVTT